jgi:hypothetical protein
LIASLSSSSLSSFSNDNNDNNNNSRTASAASNYPAKDTKCLLFSSLESFYIFWIGYYYLD